MDGTNERRFASAVVGQERRYCALAADDPWARRRSIRLEEVRDRTVVVDRRTGTTTTDLWPSGTGPTLEDTKDIDDWLAVIATGRAVGITPESTVSQYRRHGIAFRPPARRRPRPGAAHLAPPRPPPGHPRRRGPPDRAVHD